MFRQAQLTLTILTTLTVAVLAGAPPVAASGSSQQEPDRLRSNNLGAVAATFGDESGHIVIRDPAGGSEILARELESFVVYTGGDELYSNDVFATCTQDSTGGLSSCEKLDLSAGGGGTEYCSDHPDGDNWCECDGVLQCVLLALSSNCTGDLTCEGTSCACESN